MLPPIGNDGLLGCFVYHSEGASVIAVSAGALNDGSMYIESNDEPALVREFGAALCGRRSREGHVQAVLDLRYPFDVVEFGNPDAPPT
jgi:hypothetical protein